MEREKIWLNYNSNLIALLHFPVAPVIYEEPLFGPISKSQHLRYSHVNQRLPCQYEEYNCSLMVP